MTRLLVGVTLYCCGIVALPLAAADPLPNTKPLTAEGNLGLLMVDGIHKYLDRELIESINKRQARWKYDFSSPEAYSKSVEPNRERLRKILGMVDERAPRRLEFITNAEEPNFVASNDKVVVIPVRWAVLPGVDAEGLLLRPKKQTVIANVIAIPDADWTPEQLVGIEPGVDEQAQYARRLAEHGCNVLIPTLIDRADTFSANPKLNRATNQPHREFVHRMAYQMGRTLLGYEVQKVLAAIDCFQKVAPKEPIGVFGYGEGGTIALLATSLDERIASAVVSGSFGPREKIAEEPIYHNIWALLTEFGDGELLRFIFPRPVVIEWAQYSVKLLTLAPPSTRSSRIVRPASRSMAERTSATWKAIPSNAARAKWAAVVPRVMPTIVPLA